MTRDWNVESDEPEVAERERRFPSNGGIIAIIVAIWIAGMFCGYLFLSDQYTQYQRNTGDGVPTGTVDHHSDSSSP